MIRFTMPRRPGATRRRGVYPRRWTVAGEAAVCVIAAAVASTATPAAAVATAAAAARPAVRPDAGTTPEQGPGGDETGRYFAVIRRTEYGLPHILAHDYGSLGYGYGYAFAQDNLCVMADMVVTLRGERSRYFGPHALSDDSLGPPTTNLDSDIYYRGLRTSGLLPRLLARPAPLGPTPQARQLVAGYAAGYNRYLRDTTVARLPDPTCRGKSWVTPITALDVWSVIYNINTLQGSVVYRTAIASATPPTASAPASHVTSVFPTAGPTGGVGSNGWALGRDATRGHDGMVLGNPHVPWTGDARLYQIQLTIPGQLNVSGAGFYGMPAIMIGHTEHAAWTLTASHAQRGTLYALKLVPGHPTSYLVDGKAEPMIQRKVTVTVRNPGGGLSTVTKILYGSRYGPVVATGWTSTTAFALADANADNVRSLNEWLAMGRSQSLAQLLRVENTYQGLPWMYTLATSTGGTVYFADASVAPHVSDAEARRCKAGPPQPPGGPVILDGSTSSCSWGSDPDAIEPGIFGPSHYPKLTRADYVANSNNSPWLANPHTRITGYPSAIYDTRQQLELRPRLSLNMIAERLAGTDGLGSPGFTLPTLQMTMLGNRNYSADLARHAVVNMCRAHPVLTASNGKQVDVRAACAVLAAWNGRANTGSRGEVLWRQAYGSLNYAPPNWWRVPFSAAHPLTTPRGLNTGNAGVRHALADAVQFFRAHHIPLGIALGTTQHYASVPLPGCTEGEGCFDRVEGAGGPGSVDITADNGSTFIMATELTPRGPRTRTILTYSESANPDSPHFSDQTVLFSHKQWVTERFTQAQITADPQLQVTVLRG
jgi:acyl-homoserine-lactone acylase